MTKMMMVLLNMKMLMIRMDGQKNPPTTEDINFICRQLNGDFFLFYSSEKEAWVDTQFFFGATLFSRLENRVQSYCLEDYAEWVFYNNSQMEFTEDLKVNCSRVEEVCCHKLRISSSNAENSSYYGEENSKTLGDYVAIGTFDHAI